MQLKRPLYKRLLNKNKNKQSPVNPKGQYKVEKKTLKEDSCLELKGINILYINLGRLISKKKLYYFLYFILQ